MNETLKIIVIRLLRIFIVLLVLYYSYWLGFKGWLGFATGVTITAFLFYSNNVLILTIMQALGLRQQHETAQVLYNTKQEHKHKVHYDRKNK